MNNMIKGILITTLTVCTSNTINATHTNKTFLTPRPTGVDLPMEYCTFASLINRKAEDKFGGNFQVTGFYKDSAQGSDLGKYFLISNKNTIVLKQAAAAPDNTRSNLIDVDLRYLIHDPVAEAVGDLKASLALNPEIDSYGVCIDYHQDLDTMIKGLFLKASLPIACVETNTKIKVTSAGTYDSGDSVRTTILNYFNGTYAAAQGEAGSGNIYAQQALTNALITKRQDATGTADIGIALGYKFINRPYHYASIAIAITIPTGNAADGVYMFEPIYGNDQHLGLGGDVHAQANLWGDCEHNIKLNLFMNYRYLLESHEKRTLQIKGRPFSQYFQLGKINTAYAIPAANVLTLNVHVTPGSQFDGMVGLTYNNGGFAFDLGYNMYLRESESVRYTNGFDENSYQILARNFYFANNTPDPVKFTLDGENVDGGTNGVQSLPLKVSDIDFGAAATPSQFTNAIYAGLGYYCKQWTVPLMFGVTGKYEFASNNASIEQWTIAGKMGVSF